MWAGLVTAEEVEGNKPSSLGGALTEGREIIVLKWHRELGGC